MSTSPLVPSLTCHWGLPGRRLRRSGSVVRKLLGVMSGAELVSGTMSGWVLRHIFDLQESCATVRHPVGASQHPARLGRLCRGSHTPTPSARL